MTSWCTRVAEDLATLRELLGGNAERFLPRPPLDEEAVAAFEARYEVTLPEDYRRFLLEVGDGGVGPDYGVQPLAAYRAPAGLPQVTTTITMKDGSTISAGTGPREVPARTAVLAQPFLVRDAWSPVADDGRPTPLPVPAGAHPYDGTLELAEIGCGYVHLLVVTGEARGAVWIDYTAGDGSLAPNAPSFRRWFCDWLDGELIGVFGQATRAFLAGDADAPATALLEVGRDRVASIAAERGDDPNAHAAHAMIELALGRRDGAAAIIDRLRAVDPDSTWLGELAGYYHADAIAAAAAAPPVDARALARHPAYVVRRTLAANPETPAEALALLADSAEPGIAVYLIENPATPMDQVERLVTRLCDELDADPEEVAPLAFLELAVRRDDAPAELLARVVAWIGARAADDRAFAVAQRAVALAVRAPVALLSDLATSRWPEVRHAVARNPAAPAELVAALARDPDPYVRAGVAIRRDADPALLATLAADDHPEVRHNAARNPATPVAALRRLVADPEASYYLLRNPALPEDLVEVAELAPGAHERDEIDPADGPGDELDGNGLSSSATADAVLTAGKVRHHAYPVVLLMGARGGHMAGYNMSTRPWLDEALFEALAADDYAYARMNLVRRADTPAAILERLAADPVAMVRAAAAADPRIGAATLSRLLADEDDAVLEGAAQNPHAPEADLRRLAGHGNAYVRRGVARNPKTPGDLVAALAADDSEYVRRFVPLAQAATAEVLALLDGDVDEQVRRAVGYRRRIDALV